MKVKICGIKTYEDGMQAVEAGADLLGFNFYPPSPRYISPGDCLKLIVRLQTALREQLAQVTLVGVFVNADIDFMISILKDCHLEVAQLSGDEPPEVLERMGNWAYKALRPKSPAMLADDLRRFPPRSTPPAWLIDAYRVGEYGGTGQTADWDMARELALHAPILLAGGLRPENIADALRQVQPWGVDVASGVESAPGVKDPQKVKDFIRTVRSFSQEFSS